MIPCHLGQESACLPKQLTQYRVFIGSPSGLEEERRCFSDRLYKFTQRLAEPRGVVFRSVGWEETIGGVGRPQALINEELKQCDYAVFVLHDRWGTPTGGGYRSGTEEEWALAEELYQAKTIRNIALLFNSINLRGMPDPQLSAVLEFKKRIYEGKQYFPRDYATIEDFRDWIDAHLARWLNDHESAPGQISLAGPPIEMIAAAEPMGPIVAPSPDYWIAEATRLTELAVPDFAGALFCAQKAAEMAGSDIEWARARNIGGVSQANLGRFDEATRAFGEIAERFSHSIEPDRRYWQAQALYSKGIALGWLDRSEEAIAVYAGIARAGRQGALQQGKEARGARSQRGGDRGL